MNTENKPCRITIFLEDHSESTPSQTLFSLLTYFKQKGFNALCFESYQTKEEELKTYMTHLLKIMLFCNETERYKEHPKTLREQLCNPKVLEAKIELLTSIESHELQYCTIDENLGIEFEFSDIFRDSLPTDKIRETLMPSKIIEACNEHINVLVLVGIAHYEGIHNELLKHKEISDIRGYYVSKTSPILNKPSIDKTVRTPELEPISEHKDLNLVVIDLYKDSSLNATEIIMQDYTNHLAGLDQEEITFHEDL